MITTTREELKAKRENILDAAEAWFLADFLEAQKEEPEQYADLIAKLRRIGESAAVSH